MLKTLIFGAGAIGRGFLAPILSKAGIEIDFVDKDKDLLKNFFGRHTYSTAVIEDSGYMLQTVHFGHAFGIDNVHQINHYNAVFISVGPRNCLNLRRFIDDAKTVFILENDWHTYEILRKSATNSEVYFGIPDVITSNTSPPELLYDDPLCVVSEKGSLLLEDDRHHLNLGTDIKFFERQALSRHWNCKFFIHNACHAVVAYLGAIYSHRYVHQAMADDRIGPLVENAMKTVTQALIAADRAGEKPALAYMARELKRFQNPFLFDPITRVARDPFRKLHYNDRLVKALYLVKKTDLDPYPFLVAIRAAMEYQGISEDDIRFIKYRKLYHPSEILRRVCAMHDEELIQKIMDIDPYDHSGKSSKSS